MTLTKTRPSAASGTVLEPNYHEGPSAVHGDVSQNFRYFTYQTDTGLVCGVDTNVMFTIDRTASEVWPYIKDFNLWHNLTKHYYSGVVGDLYSSEELNLGEQTFRLSLQLNDGGPHQYQVIRVIPERAIVIFQPAPRDGSTGGVSPGFHIVMLNELAGKTLVTIVMEHAYRSKDKTEQQAVDLYRKETPEWLRKWREDFIPALKTLVYEGK